MVLYETFHREAEGDHEKPVGVAVSGHLPNALGPNLPGLAGAVFPIDVCGDEATLSAFMISTLDEGMGQLHATATIIIGETSPGTDWVQVWMGIRPFLDRMVA